jgi:hypothetical protein
MICNPRHDTCTRVDVTFFLTSFGLIKGLRHEIDVVVFFADKNV